LAKLLPACGCSPVGSMFDLWNRPRKGGVGSLPLVQRHLRLQGRNLRPTAPGGPASLCSLLDLVKRESRARSQKVEVRRRCAIGEAWPRFLHSPAWRANTAISSPPAPFQQRGNLAKAEIPWDRILRVGFLGKFIMICPTGRIFHSVTLAYGNSIAGIRSGKLYQDEITHLGYLAALGRRQQTVDTRR